ncbi:MAG TPA: cytochrome c-type biogenesis protein [Caulobacteraceae bacterium]|nr:cytochrome c-type biogenesis protein [Caulobacteraceae bacterium]
MKKWLAIVAAMFCIAAAPDPADMLKDPAQEARARHIFHQVRCVVCQNESIDDSEADLAHDLRQLIRGQVAQGKSDTEIRAFLISKYGDFILLKPRFDAATAIIWIAPFAIVGVGLIVLVLRRPREEPEPVLSAEEEKRLKSLVDKDA